MKVCRRCAHTRRRGEFLQTDVRTPHVGCEAPECEIKFEISDSVLRTGLAPAFTSGMPETGSVPALKRNGGL